MAWFRVTTPASDSYREFIKLLTAAGTSKHVSAAAVNAGGTGYTVGDELTITHASAAIDCILRVTSVSSGVITGVAIQSAGAFSNRVATIAVGTATGSGYAVGDIVEIQTGTSTLKAKAEVTGVSAGAVTSVALLEDGGAYSVLPTTATDLATVGVGPAGFAGDNSLELQVSTTQAIIGTSGISVTGGTGSGATFDLTLTDGGWTALRNRNNFSFNSVTDELEVVLQGTVSGGDAPIVAFRSYTTTDGINDRWGVALFGMAGFNSAMSLSAQYGFGPGPGTPATGTGSYIPFLDEANQIWFSLSPRKFVGVVKADGSAVAYHWFYAGLGNQFGSATANPYPLVIGGSTSKINQRADETSTEITSLHECGRGSGQTSGPVYLWRWNDNTWLSVENKNFTAGNWAQRTSHTMFPLGFSLEISTATTEGAKQALMPPLGSSAASNVGPSIQTNVAPLNRGSPSKVIYPAPGSDEFVLYPLIVLSTPSNAPDNVDAYPHCELSNVFWFSGTKADGTSVASEDYFEKTTGERYRIFGTGAVDQPYLYACMEEA